VPIFGKKLAFFSQTNVMIKIFAKLAVVGVKNAISYIGPYYANYVHRWSLANGYGQGAYADRLGLTIWYILWSFGIPNFLPFWYVVPREIWQPC
jgi:hypothetical protein